MFLLIGTYRTKGSKFCSLKYLLFLGLPGDQLQAVPAGPEQGENGDGLQKAEGDPGEGAE